MKQTTTEDEFSEFRVPQPGNDNWVLVLTPNCWGRGRDTAGAKAALLKAQGHTNWKTHVKNNGNRWLVVWVSQPKGLQAPYVDEMGGICAMEEAHLCKRYFQYRGHSVVLAEVK